MNNPGIVTCSHVSPYWARRAREIQDRLIKLIDAGEDLALHYHRTELPKASKPLPPGHAVVIGDGGFRRRIPIPSLEFDQYSSAKNAVVVGFGGAGTDVIIRLMDVKDRRPVVRGLPIPMPRRLTAISRASLPKTGTER